MPKPGKCLAFLLIAAQLALPASQAAHVQKPLDLDLTDILNPPRASFANESEESRHGHGQDLPEMGDSSGTLFTPMQEQELGAAFFRSLHGEVEVSQDPEVSEYIQALGHKLAANSDNPAQPFHFFVVNEATVNAFAGPGGYIGVNTGLILISEAESELASVLGHEIAHVTQRHLYQALQAQGRIQMLSFAAMLAAALIGARAGSSGYQNQAYCGSGTQGCQRTSNAGQGLAMAAMGAGTQAMINFTRDNEAEADNIGMQILSRSEFDPRSMPDFFERMQQSTRFAGRNMPEFLLTHPVTVARIADTRSRAEKFPYRQYPDGLSYQLIRAKLRVAAAREAREAVDYFKPLLNQGTPQQRDVARYGLALALDADGKADEARKLLQPLAAEYPNQTHFVNALAKFEIDMRNYPKALEIYAAGHERFPANEAIRLNYVQALLTSRKPEPARRLLEEMIHGSVVTPETYEMLGQAYSQLGDEAESHRYLAEAYYADGQTRTAILHLKLARQFAAGNFYLNAVIDDRLHTFLEEEKDKRNEK
jgi:predicted Zn-dependent protease